MQVHPAIAALRSDRAPQCQAQGAIELARKAWGRERGAGEMLDELAAFGNGAPLEACPWLEAVFTEQGEAERLAGLLSQHYCAAIAANPLGHPPFRNGFNGTACSLLLARSGRAQLMLQAREPGAYEAEGHVFSDALRFQAVLAGRAQARIVRHTGCDDEGRAFSTENFALAAGNRLALDLASECLHIDRVERRLVMLRLVRSAANPLPSREYDAASGRPVQQCAGNLATSRQEAIIALLCRMDRADAAPQFARIALGEGDTSLRWQALREGLALDSAAGFCTLGQIARRADDPLAAPAGALRAQLIETYPQFAEVESN